MKSATCEFKLLVNLLYPWQHHQQSSVKAVPGSEGGGFIMPDHEEEEEEPLIAAPAAARSANDGADNTRGDGPRIIDEVSKQARVATARNRYGPHYL